MDQSAPQEISEVIIRAVIFDLSPITFELNDLCACDIEVVRVHVDSGHEGRVARPLVEVIRPFLVEVRDWWMVTDLLHVYIRTVSQPALVSFP